MEYEGKTVKEMMLEEVSQRKVVVDLKKEIVCDRIVVDQFETYGCDTVTVFEMRAYSSMR